MAIVEFIKSTKPIKLFILTFINFVLLYLSFINYYWFLLSFPITLFIIWVFFQVILEYKKYKFELEKGIFHNLNSKQKTEYINKNPNSVINNYVIEYFNEINNKNDEIQSINNDINLLNNMLEIDKILRKKNDFFIENVCSSTFNSILNEISILNFDIKILKIYLEEKIKFITYYKIFKKGSDILNIDPKSDFNGKNIGIYWFSEEDAELEEIWRDSKQIVQKFFDDGTELEDDPDSVFYKDFKGKEEGQRGSRFVYQDLEPDKIFQDRLKITLNYKKKTLEVIKNPNEFYGSNKLNLGSEPWIFRLKRLISLYLDENYDKIFGNNQMIKELSMLYNKYKSLHFYEDKEDFVKHDLNNIHNKIIESDL